MKIGTESKLPPAADQPLSDEKFFKVKNSLKKTDNTGQVMLFVGMTTATAVALYTLSELAQDTGLNQQNILYSITLGGFIGSTASLPVTALGKGLHECFTNPKIKDLFSRVVTDVNRGAIKGLILGLGAGAIGAISYVTKELAFPPEVADETLEKQPLSTAAYEMVVASGFGGAALGGLANVVNTGVRSLYNKIFRE